MLEQKIRVCPDDDAQVGVVVSFKKTLLAAL